MFRDLVEQIYVEMTSRSPAEVEDTRVERFAGTGIGTTLPSISSNLLSGLLEAVAAPPYNGKADLPVIAASLLMEIDDFFPVGETLQMLRFAVVVSGDTSSRRRAYNLSMPILTSANACSPAIS